MKILFFGILFLGICMPVYSADSQLEKYITTFDYAARKEMKIDSKGLIKLLKEGKTIPFPELVINPLVDVAASVAEMLSDPEPGWALVVVAPCVDGGDRHPEVAGEVFNGEQPIDAFHNPILRFDG